MLNLKLFISLVSIIVTFNYSALVNTASIHFPSTPFQLQQQHTKRSSDASSSVVEVEKSCSESNVTIDQVQFQHVWDLNGLATYMTRLEQWKPFIDLETKDVRFKNGVIGGVWNFQILRNPGTGGRLNLCAVHTPEHRKPNPHDKNFFFEFKVLVTLVPPPTTSTEVTPEGIQTSTPENVSTEPATSTSTSTTSTPSSEPSSESTDGTSSSTTTTAPSDAPASSTNEDDGNNSIQRSLNLHGFLFNNSASASSSASSFSPMQPGPIVLKFGYGLNKPATSSPGSWIGRGNSDGNAVSLSSPTFQQSPVSPKTHFTFWDFESKTIQLIKSKYRNEVPSKDTKLILTFTMTELILEKPSTNKKDCV